MIVARLYQRKLGSFVERKLTDIGYNFNLWLPFPRILPACLKIHTFLYMPWEQPSTKWGQSNTKHIFNQSLLSFVDLIGLPWVCFIYTIMSLACLVFVVVFIPETKGCSLEQISVELANAWVLRACSLKDALVQKMQFSIQPSNDPTSEIISGYSLWRETVSQNTISVFMPYDVTGWLS